MRTSILVLATSVLFGAPWRLHAQGALHYEGGALNIRDVLMPAPGSYLVLYNYFFTSREFADRNGEKLASLVLPTNSGGSVAVNVDVDVFLSAQFPLVAWVSPWTFLGAKYGAYALPELANTNLNVAAATATSIGGVVSAGTVGVGDPLLAPLWLEWTRRHWDLVLGEGAYIPIGKYSTETLTSPAGHSITIASPDNIGLGFWENQLQAAGAWYPDTLHATAVVGALTWEVPGEKRGLNHTPGQMLTLNWGLSQYVPLPRSKTLLSEVGLAGYDTWQLTKVSGAGLTTFDALSRVHAVGGELNLTYPPRSLALTVHGFYEYSAAARLRGPSFGISLGGKL